MLADCSHRLAVITTNYCTLEEMKIIGHRGARGLAPENTLASFEEAIRHGADGVELDVFLTKDGVLALSHEPELEIQSNKRMRISSYSFAELQAHKPNIARLESVIDFINRRIPIVIEVKDHSATEATIACVHQYLKKGWHITDFAFCSFEQHSLMELKLAFPNAELIVNESWSTHRGHKRARQLGTTRLSMNQRWLWQGYLRLMQHRGWQISVYTVNSVAQGERWQPYLYSLYTDRPDLFKRG